MSPATPPYEFDERQNGSFARLASAMRFTSINLIVVGCAMTAPFVYQLTALRHGISNPAFGRYAMLFFLIALPGAWMAVIGNSLFKATNRFRMVTSTVGHDVQNLTEALTDLVGAYRTHRWMWVVVALSIAFGLVTLR